MDDGVDCIIYSLVGKIHMLRPCHSRPAFRAATPGNGKGRWTQYPFPKKCHVHCGISCTGCFKTTNNESKILPLGTIPL
jgi:hypothetical protein